MEYWSEYRDYGSEDETIIMKDIHLLKGNTNIAHSTEKHKNSLNWIFLSELTWEKYT